MGFSIWGAVHLHSMDGWSLSGADVQAPWHDALETVCGSIATKLSRLDACEDWKVVRWWWTQASSHDSQGVIDGGVDKAGMSTAEPDKRAICVNFTRNRRFRWKRMRKIKIMLLNGSACVRRVKLLFDSENSTVDFAANKPAVPATSASWPGSG